MGLESDVARPAQDGAGASGPLTGLRVIEFGGIGPGPFAAMMLSEMGADVVTIDRPGAGGVRPAWFPSRGRHHVELDLKSENDRAAALALVAEADILIEGFRPGVMERLGLGPDTTLAANPGLIFGRMTGWGQTGPLSHTAGHDINYIAITGALDAIKGRDDEPKHPLNLLGDYGGGALYLVVGVLAALQSRQHTGHGQVVDAAILDGVLHLLTPTHSQIARGDWHDQPGENAMDGGAFYYQSYQCADGLWLAVGCAEPQFFKLFLELAGVDDPALAQQTDRAAWPGQRARLAAVFRTRSRAEWLARFDGTDACVAPVLTVEEAKAHPQTVARAGFVDHAGFTQPAPAPRFSATPSRIQLSVAESAQQALARWADRNPARYEEAMEKVA